MILGSDVLHICPKRQTMASVKPKVIILVRKRDMFLLQRVSLVKSNKTVSSHTRLGQKISLHTIQFYNATVFNYCDNTTGIHRILLSSVTKVERESWWTEIL